jgi:hypothetical protein
MRLVAALFAVLAGIDTAAAQQLEFKNAIRTGDMRLTYRWLDHGGREFNTSFTLTREAVRDAEASFRDFSMDGMWAHIETDLREEAARFGRGARVAVTRQANSLSWDIEARDTASANELGHRLRARFDASQSAYLARHLRRRLENARIMVDFPAAARAMREPMKAVTKGLAEARDIANHDRARVSHALAFVQVIPYSRLPVTARQGGDFLLPPALLAQNRGDCDSKSMALAAVLQSYVPSRKLAVITMPGHAILAVDLPPQPGERTIRTSGRTLVALEVAGPHLMPIGQVSPGTEQLLSSRDVEVWPLN